MRQVFLKGQKIAVEDVPAPALGENEILVEVAYSLISTGTELAAVSGGSGSFLESLKRCESNTKKLLSTVRREGLRATASLVQSRLHRLGDLGYSCSGIVREKGGNVADFLPGDLVGCAGASIANHAEVVAVPLNLAVKLPSGCDLREAASVAVGSIALEAVRKSDAKLGERVAVIGLGLLGQLAVQLLKVSGCQIIGADLDQRKLEIALAHGLDCGFLNSETKYMDLVNVFTGGKGVDSTIITAAAPGNDELVQQAMNITRERGKVVVVGNVGLSLQRQLWYQKEIDLLISRSYGPGRYDPRYELEGNDYPFSYVRWTEKRNMAAYLELLARKQVSFLPLIGGVYAIEQAEKAYESLLQPQRPAAVLLNYNLFDEAPKHTKFSKHLPIRASRQVGGATKIAVVGAGGFATRVHLPNLKKLAGLYQVEAVVGRTGKKIKEIAVSNGIGYCSTDYNSVLDDPNITAVLICTRHNLHCSMAIDAAKAGKAVFLEKPMALKEEELSGLMEVLNECRVPFLVGFNRRFSPAAQKLYTVLRGRQGPIVLTYRVNAGFLSSDHWIHGSEGGGRIIGETCHMFDFFNFLVGVKPKSVNACGLFSEKKSPCENISVTVSYPDGSVCNLIYTSLGSSLMQKEYVEVFWDGKSGVLDNFQRLRFFGVSGRDWYSRTEQKGHLEELQAFGRLIHGNLEGIPSVEEMASATSLSFEVHARVNRQNNG